jgi:hypothetical protein
VTRRAVQASPQTYARLGGILYVFIVGVGIFGQLFVRGGLVVEGDAAATATNIWAPRRCSASAWRATSSGTWPVSRWR